MTPLPVVALERLPDAVEERTRVYLEPLALAPVAGADRPAGALAPRRLAGGPWGFARCRAHLRGPEQVETLVAGLAEIEAWAGRLARVPADRVGRLLDNLTAARDPGTTALMGVVNVTPDSFSDGGAYLDPARAAEQVGRLVAEGAAIVDLGAESTRPGAAPVSPEEEAARLTPLLARLAAEPTLLGGARLSIDTRHAAVMRAGLAAGASIINDVSALEDDPESLGVAAASEAAVVLMHKPGDARDTGRAPGYAAAALDVFDYLEGRIAACEAAGIGRARLIVDPGIGFGKSGADNLAILRALALYHGLGCPVLVGASRKGLTGALDRAYPPDQRLPGSLAAALHAASRGVQVLRVHEVAATRQALQVWSSLAGAIPPEP